jgi:hypothetical protein
MYLLAPTATTAGAVAGGSIIQRLLSDEFLKKWGAPGGNMFEKGYPVRGRLINFAYKGVVFSVIGMLAGGCGAAPRAGRARRPRAPACATPAPGRGVAQDRARAPAGRAPAELGLRPYGQTRRHPKPLRRPARALPRHCRHLHQQRAAGASPEAGPHLCVPGAFQRALGPRARRGRPQPPGLQPRVAANPRASRARSPWPSLAARLARRTLPACAACRRALAGRRGGGLIPAAFGPAPSLRVPDHYSLNPSRAHRPTTPRPRRHPRTRPPASWATPRAGPCTWASAATCATRCSAAQTWWALWAAALAEEGRRRTPVGEPPARPGPCGPLFPPTAAAGALAATLAPAGRGPPHHKHRHLPPPSPQPHPHPRPRTPPQILVNAMPKAVFRLYSAVIRALNNVVGGISFVIIARMFGVQKAAAPPAEPALAKA